jgi:hypothetical protein
MLFYRGSYYKQTKLRWDGRNKSGQNINVKDLLWRKRHSPEKGCQSEITKSPNNDTEFKRTICCD